MNSWWIFHISQTDSRTLQEDFAKHHGVSPLPPPAGFPAVQINPKLHKIPNFHETVPLKKEKTV
jgi:hypothetical protein